ncbi:S-adenosyl-L-methionine-dependent methyltransferase [Pyronema domesticum]|nr:S-adenosyl-L-methionine-dependent methyltransferase [Pyronema domesticum]
MQEMLEVDPAMLQNIDDEDYASSGYDTTTASLTASINQYIFENGRRYHTYFGIDKNILPTDETEQDRLDLHHEIFLLLLRGSLFSAPIQNPQRILDVGTGTGIWAIDMADEFPSAEVIGNDLSPIQPNWVPPNCRFEVDDVEQPWTYRPDFFDFIHIRNLAQGVGDWPKVMEEVFRCTKPGGYVQLCEVGGELYCDDGTLTDDNALKIAFDILNKEAMPKIGRPPATRENMTERLQKAGFMDIVALDFKHPFGPWPKDKRQKRIGAMNMLNMETGIESYFMAAATRILGMEVQKAEKYCKDAFAALKNKNFHTYNYYYVVYGRKPE